MLDDRITQSRITTPEGRNLPGPIEVEAIAEESLQRRHEVTDFHLRPILLFGLAMLIAAAVIHLVLWWALQVWSGESNFRLQAVIPPAPVTPVPMAGPAIEPYPWSELNTLVTDQIARLHSYGWIDRQSGVVHIPVERAMQLLVERGLPARTNGPAPAFGLAPAYELASEGGQANLPPNSNAPGTAESPEIHGLTREVTVGEIEGSDGGK